MSIFIEFTNGSNPFVRYNMDPKQFARELLKWCTLYTLTYAETFGHDIIRFIASERADSKLFP